MEVPRFAAVGLSLMLAVNCFMPCYTLAYADDSIDGSDSVDTLPDAVASGFTEDELELAAEQGSPIVYDVESSTDFPLVEFGDGGSDDSYGGLG